MLHSHFTKNKPQNKQNEDSEILYKKKIQPKQTSKNMNKKRNTRQRKFRGRKEGVGECHKRSFLIMLIAVKLLLKT